MTCINLQGGTHRKLEEDSGATIVLRGKGTGNAEEEDTHVLLVADTDEQVRGRRGRGRGRSSTLQCGRHILIPPPTSPPWCSWPRPVSSLTASSRPPLVRAEALDHRQPLLAMHTVG